MIATANSPKVETAPARRVRGKGRPLEERVVIGLNRQLVRVIERGIVRRDRRGNPIRDTGGKIEYRPPTAKHLELVFTWIQFCEKHGDQTSRSRIHRAIQQLGPFRMTEELEAGAWGTWGSGGLHG